MSEELVKQIESAIGFFSDISGQDMYFIDCSKEHITLPFCNQNNDSTDHLLKIAFSMLYENKSSIYLCPKGCYHIMVPVLDEHHLKGIVMSEPLVLHMHGENNCHASTIHANKLCKTAQILRFSLHCQTAQLCLKEQKLKPELLKAISENNPVIAENLLHFCFEDIMTECGMEMALLKNQSLALLLLLDELSTHHTANQMIANDISAFELWLYADSIGTLKHCVDTAVHLFLNTVFCPLSQKHASLIQKASEYMYIHYAEKITQSHVASLVYLSSSYFSKVFKDTLGCSFNEYLNRIRIEKARQLLERRDIEIEKISDMVGFENRSYFGKVFKQITNTTPKKYRDNM